MTLRLNGSTSGYVELDSPATGDSSTILLPTGGNGTLGRMQLATAQNTTSGTAIDFTGIPSWVKRVTVMFNGVSTNGTASYLVRLGTSSGFVSSGYVSASSYIQGVGLNSVTNSSGLIIYSDSSVTFMSGQLCIATIGSNVWMGSGVLLMDTPGADYIIPSSGAITLSGTLDRIRITTTSGTDTFDAGSVNILYEG